jgi:hypothetical protein
MARPFDIANLPTQPLHQHKERSYWQVKYGQNTLGNTTGRLSVHRRCVKYLMFIRCRQLGSTRCDIALASHQERNWPHSFMATGSQRVCKLYGYEVVSTAVSGVPSDGKLVYRRSVDR